MILKNLTEKNLAININGKFSTLPASGEIKSDKDLYLSPAILGLLESGLVEYYDTSGRKYKLDVWDETTKSSKSTTNFIAPTELAFKVEKLSVEKSKTLVITPVITPDNASITDVTWKSYNEAVATVDDGTVTGVKEGKVIVSGMVNGLVQEIELEVVPVQADKAN